MSGELREHHGHRQRKPNSKSQSLKRDLHPRRTLIVKKPGTPPASPLSQTVKENPQTPGTKTAGKGRGRTTDSISEPQSIQNPKDSPQVREKGYKQEKPGKTSIQRHKQRRSSDRKKGIGKQSSRSLTKPQAQGEALKTGRRTRQGSHATPAEPTMVLRPNKTRNHQLRSRAKTK